MRHRVAYLEIYLLAALVGGFLVWGGNMVANPTLSAALVYASYGVWAVVGLMVLINIIRPRRGQANPTATSTGVPIPVCADCPCHAVTDESTCQDCMTCCPEHYRRSPYD